MYILLFYWCCSLQFEVCGCIYYRSAGGLGFSGQLTAPVLHPAMDQGFTYKACNCQQLPSAFPHNCNSVRHYLCNTCQPLQQRRQRPRQQRSPPNFNLILSQPADTSFCSGCQRYQPVADFRTNRVGAPYPTCINCSTVRRCPPSVCTITNL